MLYSLARFITLCALASGQDPTELSVSVPITLKIYPKVNVEAEEPNVTEKEIATPAVAEDEADPPMRVELDHVVVSEKRNAAEDEGEVKDKDKDDVGEKRADKGGKEESDPAFVEMKAEAPVEKKKVAAPGVVNMKTESASLTALEQKQAFHILDELVDDLKANLSEDVAKLAATRVKAGVKSHRSGTSFLEVKQEKEDDESDDLMDNMIDKDEDESDALVKLHAREEMVNETTLMQTKKIAETPFGDPSDAIRQLRLIDEKAPDPFASVIEDAGEVDMTQRAANPGFHFLQTPQAPLLVDEEANFRLTEEMEPADPIALSQDEDPSKAFYTLRDEEDPNDVRKKEQDPEVRAAANMKHNLEQIAEELRLKKVAKRISDKTPPSELDEESKANLELEQQIASQIGLLEDFRRKKLGLKAPDSDKPSGDKIEVAATKK